MFANFTRLRTYVKPVRANDPDTQWLVVQYTALEAFADDLTRYGLRVAIYNLWHEVK